MDTFLKLGIAGLIFFLGSQALDTWARRRAIRDHERAKALGHLHNAYARAEMMVQHTDLTAQQQRQVKAYIDTMERTHERLNLGPTVRFDRLRQSLIRHNNPGLRAVEVPSKPSILDYLDSFATYYAENPSWGSLHVVLDDGNVDDVHVEFCIDFAQKNEDREGADLGEILLSMSKTQRRKLPSVVSRAERRL